MTELLTAAQMRAIEENAIASGAVTGLMLMERAGRGVVEAMFEEWPELAAGSYRAVVLCGPGNNGGDGFVIARLLKERGWEVEVLLYADPAGLPPDAKANHDLWCGLGVVRRIDPEDDAYDELDAFEHAAYDTQLERCVIIDALFGTGLTRGLGELVYLIQECRVCDDHEFKAVYKIAVDVPSGLCADSGRVLVSDPEKERISVFIADLTVTFHGRKRGHILCEGPRVCGNLRIVDIGLPETYDFDTFETSRPWPGHWQARYRAPAHKYTHGHALILSGGPGRTGAARLAARGALRIGAGLVTLGVPAAAQSEAAAQVTAVMLRRAGTPDEAAAVLEDGRINALCLGPGLGVSDERASLVETALKSGRAVVLDADALTLIGRDAALFALLHEGCVLTPHGGEFARLFPDLAEKLAEPATRGPAWSKVDATREAAARAGCVVLFKGPDTVIAAPGGSCAINSAQYERAAPWLATAGSGDVLAGFIAGLLARGLYPMQAAEAAAWLHVECARSFGPGLIAEDLPEELPKVFRALGL